MQKAPHALSGTGGPKAGSAIPARLGETYKQLREVVTQEIRGAILSGRLKVGERLIEEVLARRFGVSRNPVREALRTLESEGFVHFSPRRGASVASIPDEELEEIFELRGVVEGVAAKLAARRRDPTKLALIQSVVAEGRRALAAGRTAELPALNSRFHVLLAPSSERSCLVATLRAIHDRVQWILAPTIGERLLRVAWRDHEAILKAVMGGDEEAAERLAIEHVAKVGPRYRRERAAPETAERAVDASLERPGYVRHGPASSSRSGRASE